VASSKRGAGCWLLALVAPGNPQAWQPLQAGPSASTLFNIAVPTWAGPDKTVARCRPALLFLFLNPFFLFSMKNQPIKLAMTLSLDKEIIAKLNAEQLSDEQLGNLAGGSNSCNTIAVPETALGAALSCDVCSC
jgi:hypothetical protein